MNAANKRTRFGRTPRLAALLASLVACAPLAAEEADPAYTMTIIVDAAQGGKVAAGEYERAIEKLTASKSNRDPYSRQTNLCVAYTKTGEIEKATTACEAALAIMLDSRKSRQRFFGPAHSEKMDRVYLALALSNLGVLHAAKGSPDAARRTFREALELDTGLSAPKINLARLARDEAPSA